MTGERMAQPLPGPRRAHLGHGLPRQNAPLLPMRVWPGLGALLFGGLFPACDTCDREGCDALDTVAPGNGTRVAGVVASISDVVENGCASCPFDTARVELWPVGTAVTSTSDARQVVEAAPPAISMDVFGSYSLEVATGDHLLCVRPNCIGIAIVEGETLTVNVKKRDGPTGFWLLNPASGRFEEDFGIGLEP